ncbi:hypothetical protein THRCLA_05821 [Thraustotheca clavata]|uniref:TOG domain-containing protein n=1 Tax=Thraustotheca clavata TaxID=74557 RepID=A0A1V9ZSF3_9STRA|nr:hypothetical protein THRCLA_05821 [Thraustotheca clavata]
MKRRSESTEEAHEKKQRLNMAIDSEEHTPPHTETSPPVPVVLKDSGAPDNEDDLVDFVVLTHDELIESNVKYEWKESLVDASWKEQYVAIELLRQTIKFDPIYTRNYATLLKTTKELVVPCALSLRSTLARNALMCLAELVTCLALAAENLLPSIIPALLYRSVTDKKFMQALANQALDRTVEYCDPIAVLEQLLPFSSDKNANLVTKAGYYVEQCLLKSSSSNPTKPWEASQLNSWITDLANFLNCRDVKGKPAAKRCLVLLRKSFGDAVFQEIANEHLSGITLSDVLKLSVSTARSSTVRPHPGLKKVRPGLSLKERLLLAKQQQQTNH